MLTYIAQLNTCSCSHTPSQLLCKYSHVTAPLQLWRGQEPCEAQKWCSASTQRQSSCKRHTVMPTSTAITASQCLPTCRGTTDMRLQGLTIGGCCRGTRGARRARDASQAAADARLYPPHPPAAATPAAAPPPHGPSCLPPPKHAAARPRLFARSCPPPPAESASASVNTR